MTTTSSQCQRKVIAGIKADKYQAKRIDNTLSRKG